MPQVQTDDPQDWSIPPRQDRLGHRNTDAILSWFNQALGQGQAYLATQSSYSGIDDALAMIRGERQLLKPVPLSSVTIPKTAQYIDEEIALLSNIRPMTDFKCDSTDPVHQAIALQLNNCYKAWYLDEHFDSTIDEALQWAAIAKGYIHLTWEPPDEFDADGEGHIASGAKGPRDVFVINIPPDHDIQKAQAVIIREELPLPLVKARWPEYADQIKPDRMSPTANQIAPRLWAKVRTWWNSFGPGSRAEDEPNPFPVVDVYYVYLRDASLNLTTSEIDMESDKVWGYKVPPLVNADGTPHEEWTGLYEMRDGLAIPDPQTGEPKKLMRRTTKKEAMLYPNRRMFICTKDLLFRDGPSYFWHGKVPLIPVDLDKKVFQYLGNSLWSKGKSIEDSANETLRNIDDSDSCRLRPPLLGDTNVVPQQFLEDSVVNTRQAGLVIPMPTAMSTENPLKPMLPAENYNVPQGIMDRLQFKFDQLRQVLMLPGTNELVRAKQIPSGDSIEKLAELSGPGIQRLSRRLEKALREVGEQFKWLVFEFYTAAKRFEVLGPDSITPIDIDFDPSFMVPDSLDEYPELAGPDNRYRRARIHGRKFHFRITPNSAHNMTQYTRKMLYLMLMKQGFPIDPWSVSEAFDITNFGPPPPDTKTIMERWMVWQDIQLELKGQLAKKAQELGLGGGNGAGGEGQGAGGGRPNSGKKAPHLAMKEGGTRPTNSTS